MSLESLTIAKTGAEALTDETIVNLGRTVFDKLSQEEVDETSAQIQGITSIDFRNSVTRLGDGQTVRDER